jgi:ABC-type transport system substrate-binding protein
VTIHIELPFALNKGEALEVKFPAGTYERLITDKLELRTVVYLVQWKFWYLVPYLPFYSRNLINMYKVIMEQNRWLEDWVDSPGYGSEPTIAEMPWTVDSLHWNNPSFTSMNYHVPGPVYTLNPIAASWSYEWQVINRIHESLYVINPYTHDDMPWIAWNWTMEEWIDKNQGIENGMILHVYLRNDAYWQDGNQITSADVAWNFEFIESLTPPEYTQVWKPLIKYEIADPYVIRLYINATGLWQAYTMLDSALRFPKPAWEDFVGDYNTTTTVDYNAAVAYQPWTVLRNTKPGNNGPSDLTMLYGSGAYYFRYWDKTIGKGILKLSKNPNYWARVNVQNMQTTIGIDGLLYGWQQYELSDPTPPNYETTVAIRTTLTNVNMFSPVNISKHLIMYHWPTNMYEDTAMQITLSSGQVHTEVIIKDLIPLPNRIGDLGKRTGTPPSAKWFLYDDVVDGTDLALFLIALKGNAPILFRMLIDNPATLQEVEVIRIDVEWMEPWWSR